MGFNYALVHITYTIPPAILLTVLYRPLITKLDVYRLGFLITVAVISTIPWDSYLIRNRIWSYPSHVIAGPKLYDIPLEEVFFFFIQTYSTSLLYLILSKPTFQPIYLRLEVPSSPSKFHDARLPRYRLLGQLAFVSLIIWAFHTIGKNGTGTYTGLILVWACPFLLLQWCFAYQFILGLPVWNTLIPIAVPTIYLWFVDTLALRRGTWVITSGTKYGIHLWDGLEIEEALFFLVTNMLIVFGQLAFEVALSVLYTFPNLFPEPSPLPSPLVLMQALLTPTSKYDEERLLGLQEAIIRLKSKSRSFYLASSMFRGLLRSDLILLYSFCRAADDLVDNASSTEEAKIWCERLHHFLQLATESGNSESSVTSYIKENFPPDTHSALVQLPYAKLSRRPLEELVRGFEMDLRFENESPIKTENDLELYAERVAGTVAQMCNELIFHVYPITKSREEQNSIIQAGNCMGVALQYVNIARDILVDAKIGRVYIPLTWLDEAGLTYDSVLKNPQGSRIEQLRMRLLEKAFALYAEAKGAIEELPVEARGPIRVAVESYMEIGRVLRKEGYVVKAGKATVPKWRRLRVAWRALNGP